MWQIFKSFVFIWLISSNSIYANEFSKDESDTPLEDFMQKQAQELKEAQDFRRFQTESPIGEGLYKGEFLIYLCERRHFACVNRFSIGECEKFPEKKCMFIRKFEGQRECFNNQYEVMLKSKIDQYCKSN